MLYVQVAAANCFNIDSTQTCLREHFYFECFLLLTTMLSAGFWGPVECILYCSEVITFSQTVGREGCLFDQRVVVAYCSRAEQKFRIKLNLELDQIRLFKKIYEKSKKFILLTLKYHEISQRCLSAGVFS